MWPLILMLATTAPHAPNTNRYYLPLAWDVCASNQVVEVRYGTNGISWPWTNTFTGSTGILSNLPPSRFYYVIHQTNCSASNIAVWQFPPPFTNTITVKCPVATNWPGLSIINPSAPRFYRVLGQSWTGGIVMDAPTLRGPWFGITNISYPSNKTPTLTITQSNNWQDNSKYLKKQ